MINKLLFSLLLNVSFTIKEANFQITRIRLPKVISEILETDGCAIYLLEPDKDEFFLSRHYSFSNCSNYAETWRQYDWSLSNGVEYIDAPELTGHFYNSGFKRGLILPLQLEDKILGVVLTGWKDFYPLDNPSQEDRQLLQLLSQLLSDIYCVYPLIGQLREREKNLTTLYLKAEEDLEDSRKQVALELHDEVGQVLTSILLQLKLLQQSNDLDYIKGRLGGLHHITLETLDEVRRISQNLRPNLLEKLGLQAAVEAHVKDYVENTGIQVELRTHNLDERVAEDLETIVYRAVQEGLTNVARHSRASEVTLSITIKKNNLFLQIFDNGKGMEKSDHYGTGLLGMKERVTRAHGKFWLVNRREQGLSVNILLPLV